MASIIFVSIVCNNNQGKAKNSSQRNNMVLFLYHRQGDYGSDHGCARSYRIHIFKQKVTSFRHCKRTH